MVYEIPKDLKVLKAFEYAKEKIPKTIRLETLKKVCEGNLKNWKIPIEQQYVWFCLHNLRIKRRFWNGREVLPKVSFHPISVESNEKVIELLKDAIKKVDKNKFARLCNVSATTIESWLKGIYKPQITAILKACQILKKDLWKFLDGYRLNGWGNEDSFVFKYKEGSNILDIIPWVANEGHMRIDDAVIYIKQHKDGLSALKEIKESCERLGVNSFSLFRLKKREKDLYQLVVYSAVLRQILVLRYGISIGYKCKTVNFDLKNLNRNQKLRILARDLETDGCFSTKERFGFRYPHLYFSSQSYKNVKRVEKLLKDLNCHPPPICLSKDSTYNIHVNKIKDLIKLYYELFPYILHKEKKKDIIKSLSDKRILGKVRFDGENILKFVSRIRKFKFHELGLSERRYYHLRYKETRPTLKDLINFSKVSAMRLIDICPCYTSLILEIHNIIPKRLIKRF